MARVYTDEQHAWLAEHYADMTNRELADAFNAEFSCDCATPSKMNAYGSNHRLRKAPGVKGRANTKYTPEMREWLREYIPGHHEHEIIDAFEGRFGMRLTAAMVGNLKCGLGVRSGTVGPRFERGHVPANKGRTWDEFMSPEGQEASRRTQFRKGERPHNAYHELLDEREDEDGTWVYVKPRNRRFPSQNWIPKGRFVWMQANGRDWPEGHRAVFADRDRHNFDPDNIVPVPNDLYPIVTGGAHGHALPYHDRETLDGWLNSANHQGVLAVCADYPYAEFDEIVDAFLKKEGDALLVLLDHVVDPQNLGSLLRACETAGVVGVVLPAARAVGVTPASVRASAGAAEHLAIARVSSLPDAILKLKEAKNESGEPVFVNVVGLEGADDSEPYTAIDYKGKAALVVGSEGLGLGKLVKERCDHLAKLPMFGKVSSLNAGVAGAIAIYEVLRQQA